MTALLQIEGLSKRYRGRHGVQANDNIDLTAHAGEVVGLLGHNGAGKTTIVNQIVGIALPDSGTITIDGVDAVAHPDQARRLASVQAQSNVPITGLSPRRAVELVARMRGASKVTARRRAGDLIERLDLGPWSDTPAQKISGGVARLTAFCMAAAVPGRLMILDEPTNDVDPVRRRLLWEQIRSLADDGAAVLLVTHNVREAERTVDSLVVMDYGRVIAHGTPAELTKHHRGLLTLDIDLAPGADFCWPAGIVEISRTAARPSARVPAADAAAAVAWAEKLTECSVFERYSLGPTSLEEIYIELVGTESDDRTADRTPVEVAA